MANEVEKTGIRALAAAAIQDKTIRDNLNKNLHFVPLQLGTLNVLELSLKNFFKFDAKEKANIEEQLQEAKVEYFKQLSTNFPGLFEKGEETITAPSGLQAAVGEVNPETIEDGNKRQKIFREIDKIYRDTIGKIEKENIKNIGDIKRAFITFVKARHRNRAVISNTGQWQDISGKPLFSTVNGKPTGLKTPCIVYHEQFNDNKILGVMYSNYGSASQGLFTPFFNKFLKDDAKVFQLSEEYIQELKDLQKKVNEEITYETGVDIGHLAGVTETVRTVLQQKFKNLENVLTQALTREGLDPKDQAAINTVLNTINDYDAQLRSQATYGATVETAIKGVAGLEIAIENVKQTFGLNIIFVIPQERKENSYKFGVLVEKVFATDMAKQILLLPQSPSYLQNFVTYKIVDALTDGKHNFKPSNKPKKFTIPVKKLVGSKKQTAGAVNKKITTPAPKSVTTKVPVAKKPRKAVFSLPPNTSSLQNLLNAKLTQTIKQNMGSGNRRDILNLRSGRFAESVRVDRISQSRQGAISVFYTYMRNPYATFSSGGRQQNPRSRDPKLLISSSIRQLAQQITQQRLRAVLV